MSEEIDTLHVPFARFLREKGIPFINPRPDVESTIAEGHPDFTLLCLGKSLMIEFKTKDGTPSKIQNRRKAELEAAGNTVHLVRSLAVAVELVTAWHGTLGEVLAKPAKPEGDLVRFGNSIFRKAPGGRLAHVRIATTPADFQLPALAA